MTYGCGLGISLSLMIRPLRQIVFRSYRIFYDVFEEAHRVDVLHVRHGAREEPKF